MIPAWLKNVWHDPVGSKVIAQGIIYGVQCLVVSKRLGHANSQITLDVYSHAMKHDEETAAILWEQATGSIIARTRKQPGKETVSEAGVTFRDSGKGLFVVNE
jgi:hypothetical protein